MLIHLYRFLVRRLVILKSLHHQTLRPLLPVEVHKHLRSGEATFATQKKTTPTNKARAQKIVKAAEMYVIGGQNTFFL